MSLLLALVSPVAYAQASAPCEVVHLSEWKESMDQIDASLLNFNRDMASSRVEELARLSRCVEELVPPTYVARFAKQRAIVAYLNQDQEDAVRWGLASKQAENDWPWPPNITHDHAIRMLVNSAEIPRRRGPSSGFALSKGGGFFLNGKFLREPRAMQGDVPAFVQITNKDGKVTKSYWQMGDDFPPEVLGNVVQPKVPRWYKPEDTAAAIKAYQDWWANAGPENLAKMNAREANRCVLFTESQFREVARKVGVATEAKDIKGAAGLLKKLFHETPCLDAQLPSQPWADLLVDIASIEHAAGGRWQQPLTTALNLSPGVDRSSAPPEVRDWAAPAPGGATDKLPTTATFFVDGKLVTQAPDLPGLHILQRYAGSNWETRIVRGQPFPEDWIKGLDKKELRDEAPLQGSVSVLGGFGNIGQTPDSAGQYLPDTSASGAVAGIGSQGLFDTGLPVGLFWDASLPFQLGGAAAADVWTGGTIGPILGGVGVTTVAVSEGGEDRIVVVPQPHVGVATDVSGIRLMGGAGWSIPAMHANLTAAMPMGPLEVGLDGAYSQATFVQPGPGGGRQMPVGRLRAGIRVGYAFGG